MSRRRVLAVASGGGHWVQLRRSVEAFADADVAYATVSDAYRAEVGEARFYRIRDATRWDKLGLLATAFQLAVVLLRERPHVVFSTGAAPGLLALALGRLFGARTIWLDSIANIDELSLSGRRAGRIAHLWLTQWPHLAREEGPEYAGAVF